MKQKHRWHIECTVTAETMTYGTDRHRRTPSEHLRNTLEFCCQKRLGEAECGEQKLTRRYAMEMKIKNAQT